MAIRWGIIGCGDVCEVKSGPGFQKVDDSELVVVMRRDADKAADYAKRHSVPRWTTDADEVITADDVDAVYIATPPGTHMDYALRVAGAGKPCYVEKPMARSAGECERMVEAFAQENLPLYVAFYRRGLPRFLHVREWIRQGRLGEVTGVTYTYIAPRHRKIDRSYLPWRLQAEHSGGGLVMDLGSHTLDILDFLLGPLADYQGGAANLGGQYDVEDSVVIGFRTESGALGTASWNFVGGVKEDRIEIVGTKARVTLSTFGTEPIVLANPDGPVETVPIDNPEHVQMPLIQTIVDDLLDRGTCESTGVSALRTARVLDQALSGYYGGREDAFWLRPETWPGRRNDAS